jgi:hypothetical protein
VRLAGGDELRGTLLYRDSIRTTLQSEQKVILNISNRDIDSVTIFQVRTLRQDPFRLYVTPGATLTTDGGGIGLTYLFPDNWGIEFKYRSLTYPSIRRPDDYNAGGHYVENCIWILVCWDEYVYETMRDPYDESEQYSISLHRKYGSLSAQARFGWQAGLTFMETGYYYFSKKSVPGPYGSNYHVDWQQSGIPGIQAGISLDLPITRYWGLEFSLIGQLNREHSLYFLELNWPLGLVRGRRHPSRPFVY